MTLLASQSPIQKPHPKRWTKAVYTRMVERGAFQDERVYLFRGELIEMPPMGNSHAFGTTSISDLLYELFKPEYVVRIQMPFETPGESMPEPDGLVCTQEAAKRFPHPNEAIVVVEVADSSLVYDQEKALEYAAARVPEYVLLDVARRVVEIYRNPAPDPSAALGYRYAEHRVLQANESFSFLSKPETQVSIAKLLPG